MQIILPAPISEARSDQRDRDTLLNALRRGLLQLSGGGSLGTALFSTALGRGDTLTSGASGAEVIGIQFHLPLAYPSFTVNFAGEVADQNSAGVFRIRLGGTWGVANSGTLVATLNASSASFTYAETEAFVATNTQTLFTMTLQSTAGHIAQFRGGGVSLN